uniref:Uncharacterized protein n=1 Tax=Anguilla anguilla TaxID=7936 RepID=A0A0E9TTJ4_ANGAN
MGVNSILNSFTHPSIHYLYPLSHLYPGVGSRGLF